MRLVFGLGLGRVSRLGFVLAMKRETAAGRAPGMVADDLPEIKWNNACSVDAPSPSRVSISILWLQKLGLDRERDAPGTSPHVQNSNTLTSSEMSINKTPHQAARPTSSLIVNSEPYSRRRRTERSHRPKMEIAVLTGLPVRTTAKRTETRESLRLGVVHSPPRIFHQSPRAMADQKARPR